MSTWAFGALKLVGGGSEGTVTGCWQMIARVMLLTVMLMLGLRRMDFGADKVRCSGRGCEGCELMDR